MSISPRLTIEVTVSQPPAAKKALDWYLLLPALVAGAIVILGWLVVEQFARRREIRTDLRAAVSDFAGAVDEVREAAVTFYTLAGSDHQAQSLSATIKTRISSLSDTLELLKGAGLCLDANELLKRFRQSLTGGDFDSLARQPLTSGSPALARMSGDAQALTREVEMALKRHLLVNKKSAAKKPS